MLSEEAIIQLLHSVPLFSRLDRPQLRRLVLVVRQLELPIRRVICRQGEVGKQFCFVVEGSLRVTRTDTEGRISEVRQIGAGDAFGETSLLLGDVRDATIESMSPVRLLSIDKQDFDQLLEQDADIESALVMRADIQERRSYPHYSWLQDGELPVKAVRKHYVVLIPGLLMPLLFALAMVISAFLARNVLLSHTALGVVVANVAMGLILFLTLVPLGLAAYSYYDWSNDLYVVSNRRVLHRELTGIWREQLSAVPLYAIQDVQQVQIGILAQIFDYGDLIAETAGSSAGQVVFRSIPRPNQVRELIFAQRERAHAQARIQERIAVEEVMRHHFFQEEAKPRPADKSAESPQERNVLSTLRAFLRSLIPPTWHQEGATITWRKHWVGLLRAVGVPLLLFLIITVAVVVVVLNRMELWNVMAILYSLATLVIIPWLLWQFENWQNDFYQVTATRIIDVYRLPFYIREERREAALEQITNVRVDQSFWGRVLDYGDVIVETAAPAGAFDFPMVSRPDDVQREIFAHIEDNRRRQQREEAGRRQRELLEWFSIYDDIRRERSASTPEEETR